MTLLHHCSIYCTSVNKSLPIYLAFLGPLGFKVARDFGKAPDGEMNGAALGLEGNPPEILLLRAQPTVRGKAVSTSTHLAWGVPSKDVADRSHQDALYVSSRILHFCRLKLCVRAAGATDNGAPGLRKYLPGYYGEYGVMSSM